MIKIKSRFNGWIERGMVDVESYLKFKMSNIRLKGDDTKGVLLKRRVEKAFKYIDVSNATKEELKKVDNIYRKLRGIEVVE